MFSGKATGATEMRAGGGIGSKATDCRRRDYFLGFMITAMRTGNFFVGNPAGKNQLLENLAAFLTFILKQGHTLSILLNSLKIQLKQEKFQFSVANFQINRNSAKPTIEIVTGLISNLDLNKGNRGNSA